MELFRQEYLLRLGPNQGQEIYMRLKAREQEEVKGLAKNSQIITKKNVLEALDKYPNIFGPLDAAYVLTELHEDDQCDFFQKFPQCKILLLRNWLHMSDKVLRSISMSMGSCIIELDLSGSSIDGEQFEILIARIPALKILNISKCPNADWKCMSLLSKYCSSSFTELVAMECPQFKFEPLQWMAGAMGIQAKKLSKLSTLDLTRSPVEDRGIIVLGQGLARIKYLNLQYCDLITDKGVISIASSNTRLEVLNLSGCTKLTNKAAIALTNCPSLVSINLSRCNKITDKGVDAIAKACHKLQGLNLAGLLKVTEQSLCSLVTFCPGLMMLNITGCETITCNGLKELIKGVSYVETAHTYFGFKPVEDHIDKKLANQLIFRREVAAATIQESYKKALTRREELELAALQKQDAAAMLIQQCIRRYQHRMVFWHVWMDHRTYKSAVFLQRIWLGFTGRRRAKACAAERNIRRLLSAQITTIQKIFRGHRCRRSKKFVADRVMDMYMSRRREAEAALSVRIQAGARRFLAQTRLEVLRELMIRRVMVEHSAAHTIQCCIRVFLSRRRALHASVERARLLTVQNKSATRIQSLYRAYKGRSSASQTAYEIRLRKKKRDAAASLIQRVFRGYRGRQAHLKRRIYEATRNYAATTIQRIFRGSLVLHWRDMRMNIIAAFILDRQVIERKDRINDARRRYKNFVEANRKDSASEDDPGEEEGDGWVKSYDELQRKDYWYNAETQEVTYEEPRSEIYHQKKLIGQYVKIYWPMQRQWYIGTVTKFHRVKHRHRIDYEDGDHEWIHLEKDRERVQVQLEDGGWVMYQMYRPEALVQDWQRRDDEKDREDFRATSWRDAHQWRAIMDDHKPDRLLFLSEITGEMRAGTDDALSWVIQDDGYGFPSFFNVRTLETSHEDPRFVDDPDADIYRQRDFVMHELRYNLYFCQDYWNQYVAALKIHDNKGIYALMKTVHKSKKPKLLAALLVQAKALYQPASLMDKPIEDNIVKELEYVTWITERLAELSENAAEKMEKAKQAKLAALKSIVKQEKTQYFCTYCKHETNRSLQYCPTCGKAQIFY
eukprot:gene407-739_t